MSDANRVQIKAVKEVTYATTPATPTMKVSRITGETLGQDTQSTSSQELRSDRQVSALIQTGISAAGDLNIEWSNDTYDDFLESALQSAAWTTPATTLSASIAMANVAGITWTLTGTGVGTTFPVGSVGKWLNLTCAGTPAINGVYKIIGHTSATVITVLGAQGAAVSSTPMGCSEMSQLVNGTTFSSFTIQKQYVDLSNTFAIYRGAAPSGFTITVAPDQIVTGSFSFIATKETSGTSDLATTTTPATTTQPWNGITNVVYVYDDLTVLPITAFNMALNNNLRPRLQVGTLGAISIGSGTVDITGGCSGYFTDTTQMAKFLADTVTSISVVFKDAAGKYYVFDMPSVKFSAGRRVASGINTDVVQELSFTSFLDATELITLRVAKSA